MALQQNTFEGQTSGTSATGTNSATSGFGLSFNRGTGSTTVYDNAHPAHGSIGLRLSSASAAACSGSVTFTANASTAMRMYGYFTALPSATVSIMELLNAGPQVYIDSTGHIKVNDAAGATVFTSTAVLSTNTQYRFEMQCTTGASTTTGTIQFAVYAGDSTTAISGGSYSSSTVNSGSGTYTQAVFGRFLGGTAGAWDFWVDDLAYNDGATSFIGVPASPPTAAFTATPTGLTVAFNGSSSSAVTPATITSYGWNFGDTATGTGATPSHTYSAPGTYSVTLTVTDSNGQFATSTQSVTVAAPTGSVVPQSVTVSTGWTPSSGTVLGCVTDGDPTTFISSSASPSALELDFLLPALTPPTAGFPLKVVITCDAITATTGKFDAQLYEGATLRSSLTNQVVPLGAGSTVVGQCVLTFPWTDVQNVTTGGWNALTVKLQGTAS